MRTMKLTLWATYITLILLLLMNCRGCNNNSSPTPAPAETPAPAPIPEPAPEPEPSDSTDVVEEAESIGNSGGLKVTLMWNFMGDIDLRITQPNGNTIYWKNKRDTATGGFLDIDNREGGSGAAENTYWVSPQAGKYSVDIEYYAASETKKIAGKGECTVVVFQEGKEPQTYKAHLSRLKERKHIVDVIVE